jgi:hypothetical protein
MQIYEGGVEKGLREPDADIVSAATIATTTSTSDVVMSGMTATPAAGTYLVVFSGDLAHGTHNGEVRTSLYKGGLQVVGSQRFFRCYGTSTGAFTCIALVAVNGAETIEGRWRVNSGTGTNYSRQLAVVKVVETGQFVARGMFEI